MSQQPVTPAGAFSRAGYLTPRGEIQQTRNALTPRVTHAGALRAGGEITPSGIIDDPPLAMRTSSRIIGAVSPGSGGGESVPPTPEGVSDSPQPQSKRPRRE